MGGGRITPSQLEGDLAVGVPSRQVGWWRLLPSVWRDTLLLNSLPQSSSSGSAPQPDSSPSAACQARPHLLFISISPPHVPCLLLVAANILQSPHAAGTGIMSVTGFLSSLAACSTKNALKYCTPAQGHFTCISFLLLSVLFIRLY